MNSGHSSTIAVLMTCHNRRAKTVASIAALQAATAAVAGRAAVRLYLTDDGSSDGTADAVRAIEPSARILPGTGALFWNGGMRVAFAAALADSPDFYLWLNDDVTLDGDALARLLDTFEAKAADGIEPIVVGAMRDEAGRTTYSGIKRLRPTRKTNFTRLPAAAVALACESFNGNCVLVPASAARRLGNLEPRFMHTMGDLDYGLRATAAGIPIWLAPGHVGLCGHDHQVAGSWKDRTLAFGRRWRQLTSGKVLNPSEWALFCRRHTGLAWPVYWAWPYVDLARTSAVERLRPSRRA